MHTTADIVVHDQSHLEVCLNYPLPPPENGTHHYKTDFYFFIPKVMAVGTSSYSKDQFYDDITNHIRIHTPYVESGEVQLLKQISDSIQALLSQAAPQDSPKAIIRTVKLFGNTVNKRLKEGFSIYQTVDEFRTQCVEHVITPTLRIHPELRKSILLVDEYLSNRIESTLAKQNSTHVKSLLDQELKYRLKRRDIFFVKKNTDSEKEYYFFRQNLLKKVVALPLFLEVKKKKLENQYRNIVASLGAAVAAIWSQFAEHHAYKATNASDFGFQFIAVAAFAVGIYVFKDRLKDLSKEYVSEKLKGSVPDMKGTLQDDELGISGGTIEYVHYMDEKNLPAEIRFLRRLEGRWDIEPPFPDTVLRYHRTIELKSDEKKFSKLNVSAIKDILRFNFSFFMKHLDDPIKQFASISYPKVYHLNIVIKMVTEMPSVESKQERVDFEGYRLIFNRTGIIRMESLSENQKLFFTQDIA